MKLELASSKKVNIVDAYHSHVCLKCVEKRLILVIDSSFFNV